LHLEVNGDLCGQFFNSYITLNLKDFELFFKGFVSKSIANPSCGVIFHVHDHLGIIALMFFFLHMLFLFILTFKLFFLNLKLLRGLIMSFMLGN